MSDTIKITLPDGSTRDYPTGASGLEIAKSISKGLLKASVAMLVDGETVSLRETLTADCSVSLSAGGGASSSSSISIALRSSRYTFSFSDHRNDGVVSSEPAIRAMTKASA